jgi:hypothetical protein
MRILIFAFLLLPLTLFAQPKVKRMVRKPANTTIALKLDSSKTEVREFNNEAIQKYKAQKEFQYEEADLNKMSWWDRFWLNFWRFISRLFGQREPSGAPIMWMLALKYVVIALFVALIIFVIFKIAKLDLKLFAKKSKDIDVAYEEEFENIHEISFADEIENALRNQNYRLAVRLLYLQTLKHLSDKEIIDWQPAKTNSAYVKEVQGENGYHDFSTLTYQFEYIWYGDFEINQLAYSHIQQSFQQFNEAVK